MFFGEIQRLMEAIVTDETDFDLFENDMFSLFELIFEESSDEQASEESPMIYNEEALSFDEFVGRPNFVHKPSGCKIWWAMDQHLIMSNMEIKYRWFINVINQCVTSLGRRTKEFFVRSSIVFREETEE